MGYDKAKLDGEGPNGIVYGVGLGYDFRIGGGSLGIETELTDSSGDECVSDVDTAGDEFCAQVGRDFYLGVRAGAMVKRNTLIYAKAGYANGRFAVAYEDGTAGTTDDLEIGASFKGIRVGVGAEFGLSSNSYLKTEYRYTNYEFGFEKHQVVAGFGFRF